MRRTNVLICMVALFAMAAQASAAVIIVSGTSTTGYDALSNGVADISAVDAATGATVTATEGAMVAGYNVPARLVDGDANTSGGVMFANTSSEQPASFRIDLGSEIDIAKVASYSDHVALRSDQDYDLYGTNNGTALPGETGTTLLAQVRFDFTDHTSQQYRGVEITDTSGSLGSYRYLLVDQFDISSGAQFAHTHFKEFDVLLVPEPHSMAISLLGIAAVGFAVSRRRRRAA